jgi:hypothetical protein
MPCSTKPQLRKENDELRKLVVRLGITCLRAVHETEVLLETVLKGSSLRTLPSVTAPLLLEETSPSEIVVHLRDAAMQCIRLSRASGGGRMERGFENLSVELADVAQCLEALFACP